MSVLVAGGTPAEGGCWLPGYTTSTGPYYFQNSASYEQVIETAGASNPRVDTIIARVYDTNLDSSGKHEPILAALKGAEESGCTLANKKGVAAVPKSSLVLGYVLVEAKASSIVTADIANVAALVGPPTGFVTALALAAEAVTAAKIAAKAVGDAAIAANRALITTNGTYSAPTVRAAATPFTPSTERLAYVSLSAISKVGETCDIKVSVGGVEIGQAESASSAVGSDFMLGFLVPPNVSWQWANTAGIQEVKSSYLIL
jgi:hypothetical protein